MGTRADFYVGRGEQAEWLGSIAWDGYPSGMPPELLRSPDADDFRQRVAAFLVMRDDATLPARGWPWPWEYSRTTDYAYAHDDGKVWASYFGHSWFDPIMSEPQEEDGLGKAVFPCMKSRQNVRLDRGSGLIFVTAPKMEEN